MITVEQALAEVRSQYIRDRDSFISSLRAAGNDAMADFAESIPVPPDSFFMPKAIDLATTEADRADMRRRKRDWINKTYRR